MNVDLIGNCPIPQVGKASNEVLATFLSGMIRRPRMTASAL